MLIAGGLIAGLVACSSSPSNHPATAPADSPNSANSPATAAGGADVSASGDIPDNQVYVPYRSPAGTAAFVLNVPEGWARAEANGSVTFSAKLNRIRIDTVTAAAAPTVTSVQTTELPTIQTASAHFQGGQVSSVTRKGGSAVLITYLADAAPDPVTGKVVHNEVQRYEFWRAGTEVIVTLSSPQGADNVDPWRTISDSFAWA